MPLAERERYNRKTFCTETVQNVHDGCPEWGNEVLIPQLRDQSEDWRIAGVLKFEKAGKQKNEKLGDCPKYAEWVSKMGKERSRETGVRRQNGAEDGKRHSARRVSRMRCGDVQNVKSVNGE